MTKKKRIQNYFCRFRRSSLQVASLYNCFAILIDGNVCVRLTRLSELLIAKTTDSKYLLDRELLLTRKLLYQGLLIARLMSLHRQCYARHHGLQLVNRDGVSVLQITNNCSPSQSQSRPPKCFISYHQESHLLPELLTFPEHLSSSFHWGVCCPTICFRSIGLLIMASGSPIL